MARKGHSKMKNIIITGDSAFESLYRYTKADNADLEFAFHGSRSKILSALRIAWMKYSLPLKSLWYKKIDFSAYEKIIVMDTFIDKDYLRYVSERTGSGRQKHFYYWNAYKNSKLKKGDIEKNGFKVWSFDYNDCREQGFSYNPQFFSKNWYNFAIGKPVVDVTFVGRDKDDRVKRVDEIFERLRKEGATCSTYITARKWYQRFKSKRYRKYLDLRGMIKKECEGRVILDYGVAYQYGPTLRVYDAICNKRKVITNNKGVKQLKFYSPDNFFVWGEDDENRISEFLNKPFIPFAEDELDYYRIEAWVNRFE